MSNTMKTYPIIFSGPMVRALLEGRKTQTRRLAKRHHRMKNMLTGPWGKQVPGDLLWVRETWRRITPSVGTGYMGVDQRIAAIDYKATEGAKLQQRIIAPMGCVPIGFIPDKKWRPSIHMPRQYSRLTLELTDVRLQRLQDISKEDAKAEGIHEFRLPNGSCYGYDPKGTPGKMMADEITHAYYLLWESLHGADSVAENPEVIALTFRVHHYNVDEFIKQKTA